jgi:hypothetical protein
MSIHTDHDATDTTADDVAAGERYAQLEAGDTLVVYDTENHRAWIQSDAAVAVVACR